ncbi:MAG: hypothetical protein HZB11_03280 [Candidatus Yonathbacteria bacterium]|nr:hypothetical protein [Candidatus Yonathbacteria bacterium]
MDANFSVSKCNLTLYFNPNETGDASLCMQMFFEEKKSKGYSVPNFEEDFFRKFANSRKSVGLVFEYDDIGFAIGFIEEVLDMKYESNGNSGDIEMLVRFLREMEQWYSGYHTIH